MYLYTRINWKNFLLKKDGTSLHKYSTKFTSMVTLFDDAWLSKEGKVHCYAKGML